jgi:hypothetical protein
MDPPSPSLTEGVPLATHEIRPSAAARPTSVRGICFIDGVLATGRYGYAGPMGGVCVNHKGCAIVLMPPRGPIDHQIALAATGLLIIRILAFRRLGG